MSQPVTKGTRRASLRYTLSLPRKGELDGGPEHGIAVHRNRNFMQKASRGRSGKNGGQGTDVAFAVCRLFKNPTKSTAMRAGPRAD